MKKILTIVFSILLLQSQAQEFSWSTKMAETAMTLWKDSFSVDPARPVKWSYDQGVVLKGIEGVWKSTGDGKYFKYLKHCMDFFVDSAGNIRTYKQNDFNLDNVNNGRILLLLYKVTGDEKYWKAASLLREQLIKQPRTSEGGFWHKKIYPDQMWLDGLYMGEPFYAEYAAAIHDDSAFNDIATQFELMEKNSRDVKTGLLYHAWDESKKEKWANVSTGVSQNFWGRAIGWFGMALVDVLDYFPANNPNQKKLIEILNRFATAIIKVQDTKTGLWWDILNRPAYKNNYLEASASSMFVYTLAKAVRMGYLPASYLNAAQKGYNGILKKFLSVKNGQLNFEGTVRVSGLGGNPYRDGSFEYYISEKVVENDPKGIGAFIQAANEMEILKTLSYGKGKTVLLDNYFNHELKQDVTGREISNHYVWDEMDNGGYSMFGFVFNKYGVDTRTLTSAPGADNLKGADIYIIVDPDTDKETKFPNYVQQKDIEAISNWVKNGGVLFLLSNDAGNAEFLHFNKLAEKFGIHFNEDSKNHVEGNKFKQGAISIPNGNSIFQT
ncbi:MAG TPA: glycoside hydrolase family 88 protein, partial [Chitinophagaceae bacterium]|nr:glycoside hydrolase family 88 protein [Chitinophagaceae bacterium]